MPGGSGGPPGTPEDAVKMSDWVKEFGGSQKALILYLGSLAVADGDGRVDVQGDAVGAVCRAAGISGDEFPRLSLDLEGAGLWLLYGGGKHAHVKGAVAVRRAACDGRRIPCPVASVLDGYRLRFGYLDDPEPVPGLGSVRSQADDVFRRWVRITGRKATTRFLPDRRSRVEACLRAGLTPDDIEAAIRGTLRKPFLMGTGDGRTGRPLDDLTDICRTPSRVEQWAANGKADEVSGEEDAREETARRLREHKASAAGGLQGGRRAR